MTQNLDFDISSNTTLNSQTTDLNVVYNSSTGQYAEYNNGYTINNDIIYWTPASTATTINFTGTTVTGWQNSNTVPYSANKTDNTETGHASLGNYYNWTAAIASNNSSSLTQSTLNDITKNPKNSICPKGWRLPTISSQPASSTGSTNEFARLNYLYNDDKNNTDTGLTNLPLNFVHASFIRDESVQWSNEGYYMSSTINYLGSFYLLNFNTSRTSTSREYERVAGISIHCLAE